MKPKPVSEQTIDAFTPQQIAEREELHRRNVEAAHVGINAPDPALYTGTQKYPTTDKPADGN